MNFFEMILLIIAPIIIIYLITKLILRLKTKRIISELGQENIVLLSGANFFGLESAGLKQLKGNGILILTKTHLYFQRLLPRKVIAIPIEDITSIDEVRSHLGKAIPTKLLKVHFRNQQLDKMDSCAWSVRNRKEWIKKFQGIL